MSDRPEGLDKLAEAIASGKAIDWEEHFDQSPDQNRQLENLRAVAEMARLFARGPSLSDRDTEESSFTWGHLRVGEHLGSGSYGDVYRAYDPILQRNVALKLRRGDKAEGQAYIAEARRLARVRHPNVLAVHGADVHEGRVGLWADLIQGGTLERVISERAPVSVAEALDIAEPLARALAAVHDQGLVHGDVKGSNVMDDDGRLVLMDFGAGIDLEKPSGGSSPAGSPLSMAPELFAGRPPSTASDLYSLGVLLHRLVTGRYPIEAESLEDLERLHRERQEGSAKELDIRAPRALSALIRRLLAPDPADRPSADQVVARLEAIRAAPARRRRRIAVAIVVVSLAIGAVVATAGSILARRSEQRALVSQRQAETVNDFLWDILAAPRLVEAGPRVLVTDVVDQARGRANRELEHDPELRSRILAILGRTYDSLQRNQDAVELFTEARRLSAESLGPDHPHTLGIELFHADTLVDLSKLEQAGALVDDAEARFQGLDAAHTLRLRALRVRERIASALGNPRRSLELAKAAVDLRSEPGWNDDVEYRVAQFGYAQALVEVGDFSLAEGQLAEVASWFEDHYGTQNHNALVSRLVLAETLDRLGRAAEAIPMLEERLTSTEEWLGEDAPLVGQVAMTLSSLLASAGRIDEALVLNQRAERIYREAEPIDRGAISVLIGNRGLLHQESGRYEDAEIAYRESLSLILASPVKTPNELVNRFNLAEVLLLQGRAEESLAEAREARSRMVEMLGESHLFTLVTDALIGTALTRLGKLEDGARTLESALERAQQALGDNHPSTIDNAVHLARNEWQRGLRSAAIQRMEGVVERRRTVLGVDHQATGEAEAELARWRRESGAR